MNLLRKIKQLFTITCPKTEMGYNCRHQILSDGKKECGE